MEKLSKYQAPAVERTVTVVGALVKGGGTGSGSR